VTSYQPHPRLRPDERLVLAREGEGVLRVSLDVGLRFAWWIASVGVVSC
jgi:hypothetical protein